MSKPSDVSWQLVALKPASAQVMVFMLVPLGREPAKFRYCAAMLPGNAEEARESVSYQALVWLVCAAGLRTVSHAKKPKILFFQTGPPTLPPNWLKKLSSRWGALCLRFHRKAFSPGRCAVKKALP